MKRASSVLAILGLTATLSAHPSAAPQAGQAAPAQTTVLADLLKDWQAQKDTMMKIAAAMPEDRFVYKTTPAQRSYGEQILHVANVNLGILKVVAGKADVPTSAQNAKTKAQILQAMADTYDYGTALLKEHTEASILQTIQGPKFLGPSTRARIFWFLLGHSMDIYGQMAVYLRLNGVVPPASAGV